MRKQKEGFNDEDAYQDEDGENAEGYDDEQDWMPTLIFEDDDK